MSIIFLFNYRSFTDKFFRFFYKIAIPAHMYLLYMFFVSTWTEFCLKQSWSSTKKNKSSFCCQTFQNLDGFISRPDLTISRDIIDSSSEIYNFIHPHQQYHHNHIYLLQLLIHLHHNQSVLFRKRRSQILNKIKLVYFGYDH